jgi:PAS domain S-box-containing protein
LTRIAWNPYLAAAAAVLVAWAVQAGVGGEFGPVFALVPFLGAALVAAWLGGLRPTLLAMGLGYFIATYYYLHPGSLIVSGKDNLVALGLYVLVSLSTGLLSESLHQARKAAEGASDRLHTVFASMGEAVIVADAQGRITALNPLAERLTGWPLEAARGELLAHVFRIEREPSGQPATGPLERVLHGDLAGPEENVVLRTREGARLPIEHTAAPLRGPAGGVAGVVVIFRDSTEKRQSLAALRESERSATERLELLNHIYNTAPVGMGMVDSELRYLRLNDVLAAIDGRRPADCLGKTIREIVPGLADQLEPLYRQVLETGEPILNLEVRGSSPNTGQDSAWLVSYFPVRGADGAVQAVSSVVLDITDRKRSEDALRLADQRKNEFLAMLAHELRNPLAAIRHAVDLARLEDGGDGPAFDWTDPVDRQVRHLARLVDDLLDLSRITTGKIQVRPEPIDAANLVRRAAEALQHFFDSRGQSLVVRLPEAPLPLVVDPTRIEQVLQNLLHNAGKYSEPGGQVVVELRAAGDEVVISVADRGHGMSPELVPQVFDLFTQGDRSLDRSLGGLGIGLTLVREIVALHGGSVSADSPGLGQGSTFTVRLPRSGQPRQTVAADGGQAAPEGRAQAAGARGRG